MIETHTSLGRIGQVDDIWPPAVYLASSDSKHMTGETVRITGGIWRKGECESTPFIRHQCANHMRSPFARAKFFGGGNYGFFAFISSRTIASTTGFKISRVTACNISGLILDSTLATMSSMLDSGAFELEAAAGACCTAVSAS